MSTILQRQDALIKAINTKGAMNFDDKDDAYDTIGHCMESFINYQNSVIHMSIMQPIIYAKYDGQEIRDRVQDMDSRRRIAHESAISNANILNRICDMYDVDHIVNVDTSDRHAVADFIGDFCNEMYENGQGLRNQEERAKQINDRTNAHKLYDQAKIHRRIEELDEKYGHLLQESEDSSTVDFDM